MADLDLQPRNPYQIIGGAEEFLPQQFTLGRYHNLLAPLGTGGMGIVVGGLTGSPEGALLGGAVGGLAGLVFTVRGEVVVLDTGDNRIVSEVKVRRERDSFPVQQIVNGPGRRVALQKWLASGKYVITPDWSEIPFEEQ